MVFPIRSNFFLQSEQKSIHSNSRKLCWRARHTYPLFLGPQRIFTLLIPPLYIASTFPLPFSSEFSSRRNMLEGPRHHKIPFSIRRSFHQTLLALFPRICQVFSFPLDTSCTVSEECKGDMKGAMVVALKKFAPTRAETL